MRQHFSKRELTGQSHYNKAIAALNEYLSEAAAFGDKDANCCFLATASNNGQPSVRIITIHKINNNGLLFLAQKNSGKIIQLMRNPKAGVCFYWQSINMQATVEGIVEELDQSESEAIWSKRDHDAKIAAWAADLAADDYESDNDEENKLEHYKNAAKERFQETRPPLAMSWSGYVLKPNRIEFWRTQWRNIKKHECYIRKGGFWHETSFY